MKNRSVVKQDYKLVNAKYKLSNSEMKFILTVLTQIDSRNDKTFQEYTIKLSELESKLQAEQNHTTLKQFAKKLMSKPLEVPINGGFEVYNWFSKIKYQNGVFTVRIDEDLKPYLLELRERFVAYNLKNILPLTSNYSIRIYQLLKEYEKIGNRTFALEELQDILKVPKSFRKLYGNFKNKVLKLAEKELREHCDIYFEYEEIKTVRKVTHIKFLIFKNQINEVQSIPKEETPLKQDKEPVKSKSSNKTLSSIEQLKSEIKDGLPYVQFKRKLMQIQNTNLANYLKGYQPYMLLRTNDIGHLELYNQKTKETIKLDAIEDQERLENLRKYLYKNPGRIGDVKEINEEEMILNDLKSKLLNRYDTFKLKNGLHYCVKIKSIELKDDEVKITGDDIIEDIKNISITLNLKEIDKYTLELKDSVDRDLIENYKVLNISTKKNIIEEKLEQLKNQNKLLEVAEFLNNKSLELSKQYVKYKKENNQEEMKEIRKKVEIINEAEFSLVDLVESSIEDINLDIFVEEPVFRLICNQVK